jgi:hypothetical protein
MGHRAGAKGRRARHLLPGIALCSASTTPVAANAWRQCAETLFGQPEWEFSGIEGRLFT